MTLVIQNEEFRIKKKSRAKAPGGVALILNSYFSIPNFFPPTSLSTFELVRNGLIEKLRSPHAVDLDAVQEKGWRLVHFQRLPQRDVALDERERRCVLRIEIGDATDVARRLADRCRCHFLLMCVEILLERFALVVGLREAHGVPRGPRARRIGGCWMKRS